MADRRAAAFQLRSSNIRVAPLDAPGVDPGSYLVVYRAGKPSELLRGNLSVPPPHQQHDPGPDPRPAPPPDTFPPPSHPSSTTSSPTSTPPSTPNTQASIVTRPRSGRLAPRIRARPLPDRARRYPPAQPTGTPA